MTQGRLRDGKTMKEGKSQEERKEGGAAYFLALGMCFFM